jgi:hypothetical protein
MSEGLMTSEGLIAEIDRQIASNRQTRLMGEMAVLRSEIVEIDIRARIAETDAQTEEALHQLRRAGFNV